MVYEIINPSDPYTLRADDLEVAAIAVSLIGEGQYSLEPQEPGGIKVPMFFLGSPDWWFKKQFQRTFQESLDQVIAEKRSVLIDVLNSVVIGTVSERMLYDAAIGATPQDARCAFRDTWHEKKRGSMNNIGARAWAYAEHLTKKEATDVDV